MGLITCAGADVLRGHLRLGLRGAWTAELVLDTARAPRGRVTLAAAGGLSLVGTVTVAGVELDAAHVRLVGGAGGLTASVSGAFRSAQLRDPLDAALAAGGETLSAATAPDVLAVPLARWSMTRGRVDRALDELAAAASAALGRAIGWRVLSDGTVWLGSESWP